MSDDKQPAPSGIIDEDLERALALLDTGLVDGEAFELKSERLVRRWLVPPLALYFATTCA